MTYREIFLQADPRVVDDMIPGVKGYRTQGNFDICKGLKLFAEGEIFDTDEAVELERIRVSGKKFLYTTIQAQLIRRSIKGYLSAALEALGINDSSTPDELANQWLNREIDDCTDVNLTASNIIMKLKNER